jgi:prophage regulatory protein
MQQTDKILRLPEVKMRTGLSRSSIYLYIHRGTFPKTLNIGIRSVGWLESDIQQWIDAKKGGLSHAKV